MRRARASPERGPDIAGAASSRDGFPSARTKSGVRAAAVLIVLLVVVVVVYVGEEFGHAWALVVASASYRRG
jgi:hypothetical protein